MSDQPEDDMPAQSPHPVDDAYLRAEAMLSEDAAARAARRARVLAAVAAAPPQSEVDADAEAGDDNATTPTGEPAVVVPLPLPPRRRRLPVWGGWLAAASVAALSVLTLTQVFQPVRRQLPSEQTVDTQIIQQSIQDSQVAKPRAAAPAAAQKVTLPAASAAPRAVAPPPVAAPPIVAPPQMQKPTALQPHAYVQPHLPPPPLEIRPVEQPKPPPPAPPRLAEAPPPPAPPPPPPPPPPSPSAATDELVVTAQRKAEPARDAPAAVSVAPAGRGARASGHAQRDEEPNTVDSLVATPSVDTGRLLRAAAAAGRVAAVRRLLAHGARVDAADDADDTALILAVRGNHADVAAVLVRHGASLDHVDAAGDSPRSLAADRGDPAMERALGVR